MDPLSISASVSALLRVCSTVIGYLSDVKGGPKELQRLRLELCSVLSLLSILQEQTELADNADPWSSTLLSLNVPNGPIQQLRTALGRLEVKLAPVQGWKKVGKAFIWPLKKDEILGILNAVERQKLLLTLARQNDHIALARAIKGDVEILHDKVNEIGEGLVTLGLNDMHHRIRLWLSGPDPSSNLNRALERRHNGTGSWLVENAVFRNWEQDRGPSSILWLYGIPGCGKTILCATILEHVLNRYARTPNVAVLYFFFDFKDIDKQQHESMIRSLLSQLFMHGASVLPILETLYSSCMDGGRSPTLEVLLETLHQIVANFEKTFLILDALDECKARPELLGDIEELLGWKDTTLRILATSRREKEIEDSMLHLTKERDRICIQGNLLNADIRTYVHDQLQTNNKWKRWRKEPKVQIEVEDTLMMKVNGMFRWAACQLDLLESCLTIPKLRKALATLPRTLNDTYARILCDINEEYQQYALHILQWLAFSMRPLRLEEISEVIAIDVNETPQFDPQRRLPDPGDVVGICSSLITITQGSSGNDEFDHVGSEFEGSCVALAHFSVKEYLISEIIRQGQAMNYSLEERECHVGLTRDCLAYLHQFDGVSSLKPEVLTDFPLAGYAADHWTEHARVGETRDKTICQDFFLTKGGAFINWVRLRDPEPPFESDLSKYPQRIASPLYYASAAGLIESVKILLDQGMDTNAKGGEYRTALIAASSKGHIEIVQLLLEKGVHLDTASFLYGTALQSATSLGHHKIVQMLLASGADVNARHEHRRGSAFLAAIERRNVESAQLLIENGADVFRRDRVHGSPLERASYQGLQSIVELILDKNDDVVDGQGQIYSGALAEASKGNRLEIIQLLLNKGAVINSRVIQAALDGKSTKTLQVLLDHGAGQNAPSLHDAQGRTLCHRVSAQGNVSKIEMLVRLGSDLTVTDKQKRTCLHHAVIKEDRKMKRLKELHFNVRPRSYDSDVDCNFTSLVIYLLKQGFDPNLPDRDGWTPLHWAAKGGAAEIIELLEDAGAKFSVENIMGWTPNDVAVFHHHKVLWKKGYRCGS